MTNGLKHITHICELRVLLLKAYVKIVREINRKNALLPHVLPLNQFERFATQGQAHRKLWSWLLLITCCFET